MGYRLEEEHKLNNQDNKSNKRKKRPSLIQHPTLQKTSYLKIAHEALARAGRKNSQN
jgi:hypothetical protein